MCEIKGSFVSFVKLYQLTKQEGMNIQEVVNARKIVEQLPLIKENTSVSKIMFTHFDINDKS